MRLPYRRGQEALAAFCEAIRHEAPTSMHLESLPLLAEVEITIFFVLLYFAAGIPHNVVGLGVDLPQPQPLKLRNPIKRNVI